jgi:DNA-directed RNA polymerase beta subunit
MPIHRYFLADFVTIQRQSFFQLLEKGLIEEFQKRNPITNLKRDLEVFFYPEHYRLTRPEYSPQAAIIKNKSYTSKLFVPVQLTDKTTKKILLKWVHIGTIPIMTKRGHFILNGAARVIVNQILRSPGIYYQQKVYENYEEKWSQTPDDTFRRYYADLICMRGTWLRIEMDKEKRIWAQTKKGPKIPIYWFLVAMGLSEKMIFKSIRDSSKLLGNLETPSTKNGPQKASVGFTEEQGAMEFEYGGKLSSLESKTSHQKRHHTAPIGAFNGSMEDGALSDVASPLVDSDSTMNDSKVNKSTSTSEKKQKQYFYVKSPPEAWRQIYSLVALKKVKSDTNLPASAEEGRKWLYNRFLNPRAYDLGKQGRFSFNKKLGLNISLNQTTLTGLDVLYATDYLIKVEKGLAKIDDIDHLKNRRVRTSGELIQIQIGVGLVRLEKNIRETLNKTASLRSNYESLQQKSKNSSVPVLPLSPKIDRVAVKDKAVLLVRSAEGQEGQEGATPITNTTGITKDNETMFSLGHGLNTLFNQQAPESQNVKDSFVSDRLPDRSFGSEVPPSGVLPLHGTHGAEPRGKVSGSAKSTQSEKSGKQNNAAVQSTMLGQDTKTVNTASFENLNVIMNSLMNTKAFNSAIREFFGTSPLSQFMDQINPLAELTHKRRLSSMGPGGVTRDTATLEIRGIHPTHYGRICPIETPEGKNTGLVNSMTTYARINANGIIESPFYKVYKGQVQKNTGMYYFSAEQEEKVKLAAADLSVSSIGFLPKSLIPVRIAEDFTKIPRSQVQYIGVSPLQMISIAASLIPFLEHDDANRALMGSNMQRQAVPLIRPERPIVGTGLEARAVSDSGHALISKYSGVVTYVSGQKIIVHSFISE